MRNFFFVRQTKVKILHLNMSKKKNKLIRNLPFLVEKKAVFIVIIVSQATQTGGSSFFGIKECVE